MSDVSYSLGEKHRQSQGRTHTAHPKDADGADASPASIQLYLNYAHAADGTTYTDEPIQMQAQTAEVRQLS